MADLIAIKDLWKTYQMGETSLTVLKGVSLTIEAGEFAAIMGPSGSGKSTLMHIMGLLDHPDRGSYQLLGEETAALKDRKLAALRAATIGFVFQQFHLLRRRDALRNVALPMIYAAESEGLARAGELLEQMRMSDRSRHRPSQLSGGQQQRVAIARALVNRPLLLLADEPTGNLDSQSSEEVLQVLRSLNAQGLTIVLVTHEEEIARHARRILRLKDGILISDERRQPEPARSIAPSKEHVRRERPVIKKLPSHLVEAYRSLRGNRVRSLLSVLGVLIGVAAVIAMLAIGEGAKRAVQGQLASLGSNLLVLRPGAIRVGGVALDAGAVTKLTLDDVEALRERTLPIREAAGGVMGRGQVTYGNKNWSTQIMGTGQAYARMRAAEPVVGRFFTEAENQKRARVVVLGMTVIRNLFGDRNPVGEQVRINRINFQVIGVLPVRGATGWRDQDDVAVIPILTAMYRLLGKDYIDYIDIEVSDPQRMNEVEENVKKFALSRHRVPASQSQDAFEVRNMADIQSAVAQSTRTMSLLLSCIAAISLLVGGIGIMNIMLVSVTERTQEIGLRKALGATGGDILWQFLVEASVLSAIGGLLGVAVGIGASRAVSKALEWTVWVNPWAVIMALSVSALVGIVFGLYPARRASRLRPIDALRHE